MILVFDLDDTLYDESTYVLSGMKSVAKCLAKSVSISESKIYKSLLKVLREQGRGKVFDLVLQQLQVHSKKRVKECVSIYRLHEPKIKLSNEGAACLKRFKSLPKYLVTDGNRIVQLKKIQALNMEKYFKKTFRTYQYGLKYSKPSTFCFKKIVGLENVNPSAVVYIGDNPNKDFISLKKEGFRTIRLRSGMFKDVTLDKNHEAHFTIQSLDEVTPDFLKNVFRK